MTMTLTKHLPTDSPIPLAEEQPTMSLWPETGRALGLGRSGTYAAASRGDIPSIRLGGRVVVPTAALRRLLQLDGGAS